MALVLGAIGIMLVVAAPANAHAALVSASPAPGASLPQAPGAVVLRFSEAVELRTSTVAVTGPGATQATNGPTVAVAGDERSIRRPLGLLQPGRYIVRWTSVSSDDGHMETGSYSFAIGVAASTVRHVDAGLFAGASRVSVLGRLVTLVGLALWGGLFVVARAARRSGISPMRLEGLVRLATAAALVGSIAVLGDRLATTPVDVVALAGGRVAQLDAIVLVSALVGAWSARRHATATRHGGLVAVSIAITAELATGHAAAGAAPLVTTAVLAVHLLGVGVWVAAIVTSLVSPRVVRTLKAMSPYAIGAAGAVLATGAVATAVELRSVSALTTTSYGVLVLAKFAVFVVVVAAGLLHLRRRRNGSPAWRLRRPLRLEALAAGTAIALGTVLSGAPPPSPASFAATTNAVTTVNSSRSQADDAVSVAGASGPFVVGLTLTPPRPGRVQTRVRILGGASADPPHTVRVSGAAPGRPPFSVMLHHVGAAAFAGTSRIHGRGVWTITVALTTDRRQARVDLHIPLPTPSGRVDLARALAAEEHLTSLQLHESVRADTAGRAVIADYVFGAPDLLQFTTGGTTEIDIGKRTYRRDGLDQPWSGQRTDAAVAWPSPYFRQLWGPATSARVVGTGVVGGVASDIVVFTRPDLPAWFRIWVGHDGLVRREEMLAEAHLMVHTYSAFDHAPPITAPPSTTTVAVTHPPISQ